MELRQLEYSLAVAHEKSFTLAARRLHVVLPLLASRLELLAGDGVRLAAHLGELWVDLGTSGVWPAAAPERVVYGSGSCFTPADGVARQLSRLDAAAPGWRATTTANAGRLFGGVPAAPVAGRRA